MKIGVVDSCALFKQPYFLNKCIDTNKSSQNYNILSPLCPYSHGEYVCATILRQLDSLEIFYYDAISSQSVNNTKNLISSIQRLIEKKVNIINLSLGIEHAPPIELVNIINEAVDEKIIVVAAHPNKDFIAYPAISPNVIGVETMLCDATTNYQFFPHLNFDVKDKSFSTSIPYTSFFHLHQSQIISGNSFIAATISGFLGALLTNNANTNVFEMLEFLCGSPLNKMIDFETIKDLRTNFITNRMNNEMQKRYTETYPHLKKIYSIESVSSLFHIDWQDTLLICDIDTILSLAQKKELLTFFKNSSPTHIVMRYPNFTLLERLRFYQETQICIHQFFL